MFTKKLITNSLNVLKKSFKICKEKIIHNMFLKIIKYALWIFNSAIFMKVIIKGVEGEITDLGLTIFIFVAFLFYLLVAIYKIYINNIRMAIIDIHFSENILSKIYLKASKVLLKYYEDNKFYDDYISIIKDIIPVINSTIENSFDIVFGFFSLIYLIITMSKINILLPIFIIFPILGNFLIGKQTNKLYSERYKKNIRNTRKYDYPKRLFHLANFAKDLRMTNISNPILGLSNSASKKISQTNYFFGKKISFYHIFQNYFTFTLMFEGTMLYSVYLYSIKNSISFSQLSIITSIMVSTTWILFDFTKAILKINENNIVIERFKSFLKINTCEYENPNGLKIDRIEKIEFKNVSFKYDNKDVLSNISFVINKGETIGIVGINGAGKSTVIKLLLRLYLPQEGIILVNDINIEKYNLESYWKCFSTAFQDYIPFAISVKENIALNAEKSVDDEKIFSSLVKTKLIMNNKLDINSLCLDVTKEFSNNGIIFSGGQLQKLSLASIFTDTNKTKILDEPTSALDPISEKYIYKEISKDNNIVILITHRLSSAKYCDKIIYLENGRILEFGTHLDLMKIRGKYYNMFKIQADDYIKNAKENK